MEINKSKIKKWLVNLSVLVLSIVLILIVLEIGVRIFTKPVYPILRTSKEVGKIYEKNFEGQIWNDESNSYNYIKTNSIGYIGEEISKQKTVSTTRIVFFGDSMTAALQVDYYNNFVSKLNTALSVSAQEGKKQFEILNFGVGGTGTFLQYLTYKHNVMPLSPDAIFLVFHINDYSDNLNKINFDIENYAQEETRKIWLKDFLLRFQLPKYVFVKLQHNLLFLEILNKFGLYELNDYFKANRQGLDISKSKDYYKYTFSIIRKFRELVQKNNTEFFVIFIPHEADYQSKDSCQLSEDIAKMTEFLEESEIEYLDPCQNLYEARINYSAEECFDFSCGGGHMTKLGHQEFAKILFKYIKDKF